MDNTNKFRNNVYIARERSRVSGREYLAYGMGVMMIIMGTLLYIWPNVKILHINYELTGMKNKKNKLFQHNRLLRIEVESLSSFNKIEQEAVKKGFTTPKNGQIVYVLTD